MICIQLKIKCKIILIKTLENRLNKSYFMIYHLPSLVGRSKYASFVDLKERMWKKVQGWKEKLLT